MNNHLITNLVFASMLTASSLALAGQPSPNAAEGRANAGQGKDNAGKPSPRAEERSGNAQQNAGGNPKVQIAHCGCNYDGNGLEWKHIRVSTNAKGHLKHTASSEANCINVLEEEVPYTRGFDDCRISDEPSNNIGGLARCDDPEDLEDLEDLDNLVDTVPEVGTNCEAVVVEPDI
jgi:hypothetical protein